MDIRRAADRAVSGGLGVELRHSLSAGHSYDPTNTSYGPMVAHDEIVLAPGAGFPAHRHRDLEIVTWVLAGGLVHEDDVGPPALLGAGAVQVLSAGRGAEHRETAAADGAHVVQVWLLPEALDGVPSCVRDDPALGPGLTRVTGAGSSLPLGCDAVLSVGRPERGAVVDLPTGALTHLHVGRGQVVVDGTVLRAGDALRRDGGGGRLVAGPDAEVLLWLLGPRPRRAEPGGAG